MNSPLEVVETQNAIIALQSQAINDLFSLLMQHITAEEADALPVVNTINRAADLRASIDNLQE